MSDLFQLPLTSSTMMLVWHSTEVPMIAIGADGKQVDEQRVVLCLPQAPVGTFPSPE